MLQQLLKEATKINHDELEQLMFVNEIMNGTLSVEQYQQILITNYVIHKAYEDELFNNLSAAVAEKLNINRRHKLAALAADLQELQTDIPVVTQQDITFEKNDPSILGAMYVMEGATLGGSVIVKRLQTNLQLNNLGLNFNYYQVYGSNLIPYWKSFCEELNQQPESAYGAALNSAQKMFDVIARVQQNNKLQV